MTRLEVAITQLGVQEVPKNSNWGPDIQKYLASVNLHKPNSWCAAFVYWCSKQANPHTSLYCSGGVLMTWNKTKQQYKFKNPMPNDIFIMDFGKGLGHTGIVERVEGNIIHTIEGNTNDENSREGYEVCRRERPIKSIKGFIRIS